MENNLTLKELWLVKRRIKAFADAFYYKRNLRLEKINPDEITEKFSFQSLQNEYPEFCELLKQNKPCHELNNEDFNCYFCFCHNYETELSLDKEQNLYKFGQCKIKSKFASYKINNKGYLILTCINCKVPHYTKYVKKSI